MEVATIAALMRSSAGSSDVETTTTLRARPSGPRSRSMNSRTSRPRSPISAITFTSVEALRAIIPSTVLLPTPEPAKMPTRWPLPAVSSPSMARTPVVSRSTIPRRRIGCGGVPNIGLLNLVAIGPRPSMGRPSPSTTRPSSSGPTGAVKSMPSEVTRAPACTPCRAARGISWVRSSLKLTISASSGCSPSRSISHTSPISPGMPCTSTSRPTTWLTRPHTVIGLTVPSSAW